MRIILLQKTFVSQDEGQLDNDCNEFRKLHNVKFSQSSLTAAPAIGGGSVRVFSHTLFYEVTLE